MLLVVLLEQSGTAGTAWNKCWDSLDRPSQLGTLLGELGFWDNWTVLSSTVQVRVGLLIGCSAAVLPHAAVFRGEQRPLESHYGSSIVDDARCVGNVGICGQTL